MENKGNPYHDKEGKFTTKGSEGSGAEKKEQSEPLMDLFGRLMKTVNEMFPQKEKKEQPKMDLDSAINKEIDSFNKLKNQFNWHDTPEEMAENIAYGLSKEQGLGDFEEIKAKVLEKLNGNNEEETIAFDSDIQVNLPDGGSEPVFVENIGDKLLQFLEGDVQLSDEQKQFIRENGELPKSLNPYNSEEQLQEEFSEWLQDNYDSNEKDKSDYDFERGFVKGMKGGDY